MSSFSPDKSCGSPKKAPVFVLLLENANKGHNVSFTPANIIYLSTCIKD